MKSEILQLCRLCLVKDQANIPIFEEQDDRQILVKITACLPTWVSKDDSLPKKICDSCVDKLDSFYQFRNTTVNAEKQLLTWLGQAVVQTEFKMQADLHSIKQEELDPLESTPENSQDYVLHSAQTLAGTHNLELVKPSKFHAAEDERFQKNYFEKITPDYSGPAPAKRRRQQVDIKLLVNDNCAENKEEICRPPITTVIVKSEKDDETTDGEDVEKNQQMNFMSSGIHVKEQSDIFGMEEDDHDEAQRETSKWFQTPSSGQCHICGKVFLRKPHLRRHIKTHTDERPVSCDICCKRFKDKFSMKVHKKYHSDARPFNCDTCDKTFKRKISLEYHQKRHAKDYKITCEICNKGFYSDAEYKLHLGAKHNQNSITCPICNKLLYNKTGLNKHMKQHAENYKDAKYKCDLCEKSYLHEKYLKMHIKNQHMDGLRREYVCDLCGKKVYSGSSLRAHQRLHEGIKPNKCDTCGKGFNSRSNLIVHLRTHTGDKPHKCEHCHKAFTQRNTYVIHMRSHTGERPYVCQLCDTGFVSRTALNLHHKSKHNLLKTQVPK